MRQTSIVISVVIVALIAYFGAINYFIVYLPNQAEISDGYRYKYITEWMNGEDAHHYLPTINRAMEDGVMQVFEYHQLRDIDDALILKREKAKFDLSFANHPHTDHSYLRN